MRNMTHVHIYTVLRGWGVDNFAEMQVTLQVPDGAMTDEDGIMESLQGWKI